MMKGLLFYCSCVLLALSAAVLEACSTGEVAFREGCVAKEAAVANATAFLKSNLPPWDEVNVVTLFGDPGGVDGLDTGVASVGVNASVEAQATYPWAADVPEAIFDEYVAGFAFTNEPRTDWREFFSPIAADLVANATTQDEAIAAINGYGTNASDSIWQRIGVTFKSGMTPLIFDPMSTVAFKYASCTGISATFVAALRSIGVPARVVGTPAWRGDPDDGNHNWVEIWRTATQDWAFIEGKPSGGGENLTNPCNKWFCNPSHFPTTPNNATSVYAARFDAVNNDSAYVLAWDPHNLHVPADDRSDYYTSTCSVC